MSSSLLVSWLDSFFGPAIVRYMGEDFPQRERLEFDGDGVSVEDSDVDGLVRVTIPATTLYGDDDDIAHIAAIEVIGEGDAKVTPHSKVGHVTTEDDTPVDVVLFTLAGVENRRIDVVVTATNEDGSIGGTWTIRARGQRTGGVSSLASGGVDPSPDTDDGDLDAAVVVTGDTMVLRLTGLELEEVTFGWEARSQRQLF